MKSREDVSIIHCILGSKTYDFVQKIYDFDV